VIFDDRSALGKALDRDCRIMQRLSQRFDLNNILRMQPKGEEPPRIVNGGEVGEGPRGPSNDIRMPHLKKGYPREVRQSRRCVE